MTSIVATSKPIEWPVACSALVRPLAGEEVSGDAWGAIPSSLGTIYALVDGVGHGVKAAEMAQKFLEQVHLHREQPLCTILESAHKAMRGSRGAVAALVRVKEIEIEYSSIGNISAILWRYERMKSVEKKLLMTFPGVLGASFRNARMETIPFGPNDFFLLHSDGIRSFFDNPPFHQGTHHQVLETLLRNHGKSTDDASLLLLCRQKQA